MLLREPKLVLQDSATPAADEAHLRLFSRAYSRFFGPKSMLRQARIQQLLTRWGLLQERSWWNMSEQACNVSGLVSPNT